MMFFVFIVHFTSTTKYSHEIFMGIYILHLFILQAQQNIRMRSLWAFTMAHQSGSPLLMPIKISHSYFICYLKLVVLTEIVGPTPSTPLPCEITKVVCFNPDFL